MLSNSIEERIKNNPEITSIAAAFLLSQIILLSAVLTNPPIWDSSIYIGMGKYLYTLGEIGLWESFRPPLVPILFGALWKIGLPALETSRILALTLSSVGIGIFYYAGKRMTEKKTAIYATGILIATYVMVAKSTMLLTGIVSAILLFAAAWLFQEERYSLSGLVLGLAFLARFPTAIGGPILAFFCLYQGWKKDRVESSIKKLLKFGTFFGILLLPYLALNQIYLGSFLQPFIRAVEVPAAASSKYVFGLFYLLEASRFNPLLLLSIPGLYYAIKKRDERYLISSGIFVVSYMFFTVFPHKEARYMLLFLPFMAILAGNALKQIEISLDRQKYFRWAFVLISITMITAFTFHVHQENQWINEDKQAYYEAHSSLEGVFAANDPVIMAYGDLKYEPLPPSYLPDRYRKVRDKADYFSINSCAWYCTSAQKGCAVDEFTSNLSSSYEKSFELKGQYCNYTIYRVD